MYKDFGYDMGIVENLVKRDAPDDKIIIKINNKALTIHLNEHPKLSDVVNAHTTYQKIEHSYLCAERLGPRNTIEYHNSPDCGIHGEYTPYIISKDSEIERIQSKSILQEKLVAPVENEKEVGEYKIYFDNDLIFSTKIYTMESVETKDYGQKLKDIVENWY